MEPSVLFILFVVLRIFISLNKLPILRKSCIYLPPALEALARQSRPHETSFLFATARAVRRNPRSPTREPSVHPAERPGRRPSVIVLATNGLFGPSDAFDRALRLLCRAYTDLCLAGSDFVDDPARSATHRSKSLKLLCICSSANPSVKKRSAASAGRWCVSPSRRTVAISAA
jgi:hypothetical protein